MAFFFGKRETGQEQEKFNRIYDYYRNLMYHVAYKILNNHHDAEDATADALCKLAQNISKIGEPICPKTRSFVVTVTERQAIDLYRRKKRRAEVEIQERACNEEGGRSVEMEVMERSALAIAIAKLPEHYREVIILKFAQGYSTKEIAKILGYSVPKVEKLIARGKAKLEIALKEVSAK